MKKIMEVIGCIGATLIIGVFIIALFIDIPVWMFVIPLILLFISINYDRI